MTCWPGQTLETSWIKCEKAQQSMLISSARRQRGSESVSQIIGPIASTLQSADVLVFSTLGAKVTQHARESMS